MDAFKRAFVGQTEFEVTALGFGGGTLGDPYEVTEDARADEALAAAYDAGVRYFDTAPWYGNTKSEHRLGRFLRRLPRDSFALSTKVGRLYIRPKDPTNFSSSRWATRWRGGLAFDPRFDYTAAGIMRSYEDSLQRMGLNTVDALTIHDLDFKHQINDEGVQSAFRQLGMEGGFAALDELKRRGEIAAIGAGINHLGMIPRFLADFDMDYFLLAMPYTLLDQSALDEELPLCERHGVSVIIGAVFASGILATGARPGALYGYLPAEPTVVEKVGSLEAVCTRHGVALVAAALQFPMAHPQVVSVIPGPGSSEHVRQNIAAMSETIPADFWAELKHEGLLRADAPTPG